MKIYIPWLQICLHSQMQNPTPIGHLSDDLLGRLWEVSGLRQSVAPRALAFANFPLLISTAMILEAPDTLQPITAERPMPPRSKMA